MIRTSKNSLCTNDADKNINWQSLNVNEFDINFRRDEETTPRWDDGKHQ